MKGFKSIIRAIALTLALAAILSLVACGNDGEGGGSANGRVTIVVEIAKDDYIEYVAEMNNVKDSSEGVLSVIKYLAARAGDSLTYTLGNGPDGAGLSSICDLRPASDEVIAVYTSVGADAARPPLGQAGVASIEYGGHTLILSGKSLAEMTASDGAVILFRLENAE